MKSKSVGQIRPIVQAAIPFMAPELQRMASEIAVAAPYLAGRAWEAAEVVMWGLVTVGSGQPYPFEQVRVREFDSRRWYTVTLKGAGVWHCDCGAGRFCLHELAAILADEDDEDETAFCGLISALESINALALR